MKNIKNFNPAKYGSNTYIKIEDGIYAAYYDNEKVYVTSLSFVQEPDLGEGTNASGISQYPLEDLLDKFYCYISDFYEDLNTPDSINCCLEFASPDLEDIKKLTSIIDRHVYNKEINGYVKLIIE